MLINKIKLEIRLGPKAKKIKLTYFCSSVNSSSALHERMRFLTVLASNITEANTHKLSVVLSNFPRITKRQCSD